MERRTFLALMAAPAVAQLLASCGSDGSTAPTKGKRASLRSDAARTTTGADPAAAAAAVNGFAADLHEQLVAARPDQNLVFSPASIAIALAMTSAGAKGATLAEMDGVLHITDAATIHRSMNGLAAAFDACTKEQDMSSEGGNGIKSVKINIANSLWGQSGLTVAPTFLDTLSSEYGAGMETVDFRGDANGARKAINGWTADATEDRIPELIAEGGLSQDTLLTLVNAVYLKANWAQDIYPEGTKDATFTTSTDTKVTVPMMTTGGELPYADGDGWQATALPYAFGDLDMVFAVGESATTTLPEAEQLFPALATALVVLHFPRFDTTTSVPLGETLQAMGMTTPFSDQADFSGITTDADLFISDVIHQANITVDEKGTEAAAATAVVMAGSAAPVDPPKDVLLNRPFTFWIRHVPTGAILFMGRINDPTA